MTHDTHVRELGLPSEKTKTVHTPENRDGTQSCAGNRLVVSPLLSGEDTPKCRSLTTRAAYLAMDRTDLVMVSRTCPDECNNQERLICSG